MKGERKKMKQQKRIENYLGAALGSYTDLQSLFFGYHSIPISLDGARKGEIVVNMELRLPLEKFMEHYVLVECQMQTPESREIKVDVGADMAWGQKYALGHLDAGFEAFETQVEAYQQEAEAMAEANLVWYRERHGRLKDALARMGSAKGSNYKDTVKAVEDIDELAKWQTRVDVEKLHTVLRTLKQPADLLAKMGIAGGERVGLQIAHSYNSFRRFMIESFGVMHPKGVYDGKLDLESIAHYIHKTAVVEPVTPCTYQF